MDNRKCMIGVTIVTFLIAFSCVTYFMVRKNSQEQESCPATVRECNGTNELYHVDTDKCFIKGQSPEGICGNNMAIMPALTCKSQGQCECDYERHDRMLIYDKQTSQCYFIYSQGPCPKCHVVSLATNVTSTLECIPDVCLEDKTDVPIDQRDDIVPFKNKCYRLHSKLNVTGCKGELKFWKYKPSPSCDPPASYKTGAIGAIGRGNCVPGSYRSIAGGCFTAHVIDLFDDNDDVAMFTQRKEPLKGDNSSELICPPEINNRELR